MGTCLALWIGICLLLVSLHGNNAVASAYEFKVGGLDAWALPTGGRTDLYQNWAANTTFKVGDSFLFLYPPSEDSVIQVTKAAYIRCDISNPIAKFQDGNTVFKFQQWGSYYFTSGVPGHCEKSEKLAVLVLGANGAIPPQDSASAPALGEFGGSPANSPFNSFKPTSSAPTLQPASSLGIMVGLAFGLFVLLF